MKIKHLLPLLLATVAWPFAAQADEIQLTLSADAVGTTKELALNADLSATLQWGDGTTQVLHATGLPQSVEVKHTSLTIKTDGTNDLTQVFAPSFGVTKVAFTTAKGLEVLDLSDNAFDTTPTFSSNTLPALRELYMRSSNLRGSLALGTLTNLELVDLSNNALTSLQVPNSGASKMRSLVVSGNQLKTTTLGSAQKLATVWVNDNQIRGAKLTDLSGLTQYVASGNEMVTITLPTTSSLKELWVDENKLTTLDLSNTTADFTLLSAENNALTEIKHPTSDAHRKIRAFYVRGNALPVTSMIHSANTSGTPLSYVTTLVGEQKPVALSVAQVDPNVALDVKQFFTNANAYNVTPTFVVMNSAGEVVDASKYTVNTTAKTITFKEALGAVYLSVTAKRVPNAVFKSSWFDVGPVTAINSASADKAGLDVTAVQGGLVFSVASPVGMKVYSVSGAKVYDAVVSGTTTVSVPAGVYVVNGQKVLVP